MERGELVLQERKQLYLWLKYPIMFISGFIAIALFVLCIYTIILWWGKGFPGVYNVSFSLAGLFFVVFFLLYVGVYKHINRLRFQIYENGIIPYRICMEDLRKGQIFVPWEKITRGAYADPHDETDPLTLKVGTFFLSIIGRRPIDSYMYLFEMEGPPLFPRMFGRGPYYMRILVGDLVGPKGEKYTSEGVLRILKEKIKIDEKIKMYKFDELCKMPGVAGTYDTGI